MATIRHIFRIELGEFRIEAHTLCANVALTRLLLWLYCRPTAGVMIGVKGDTSSLKKVMLIFYLRLHLKKETLYPLEAEYPGTLRRQNTMAHTSVSAKHSHSRRVRVRSKSSNTSALERQPTPRRGLLFREVYCLNITILTLM